jgi:ABC-2 type transport system permease protein
MTSLFPAQAPPGASLSKSVWKLLRLRLKIFVSSFQRARLRRKLGIIALALLALGALAFAFVLSWLILRFMRSPQLLQYVGDAGSLLESVPVIVVSAAFFGILLTSFGVLLQALYLAGDMDFLLSAPVPIRAVFISKLLQAILPNFGLVVLFGLPVLYGLGASRGYNLLYYPLVLIVLIALALAAAGLSSLLVMLVVRIFPARRVAEVLGLFVGVVSLLCGQSGQLANYSDVSPQEASKALGLLSRLNSPWSPLAWAGRGLADIGAARWLSGLGFILLSLGVAGSIFILSLSTAERLYFTGWANVQLSSRRKKTPRPTRAAMRKRSPLGRLVEASLPAAVRGIFVKDLLVLRRDLRNMSQLVTPLLLGVIYAFMLIRGGGRVPAGRGEAPAWFMQIMRNVIVYANVGLSLFVGWSLLSRLALMGFSQEGKNYWILKTAPVNTRRLLLAKFLVAFIPALVLGWGFLLVISLVQQAALTTLVFGLGVVALCIAGTAGLNLAFGVAGANFDWEDPRRMNRGSAGCLGALASIIYLVAGLALFFGPAVLAGVLGFPETIGQLLGLALGGSVSLVVAVLPLWLVRGRVPQLGEA